MQPTPTQWFRNSVLYQIYPRSFYDSNNDGIGDLEGIRNKLGYLADLGVGVIWLSPFYPSPMADFGYDVSDYNDVDPIFGSLEDFKALLSDAHKLNIKIIIDFIPNHTSDIHPWFIESKSSKENPRRDWYTWRDPAPNGGPPNNWRSIFGGVAWELDQASGQYYLHSFLKEQPDLNWENAGVRAALCEAARFWLELGVDGFRVDTMYWIAKDPLLRNDPINQEYDERKDNPYDELIHANSHNGPKLFQYFNELVRTVKSYPDKFIIVETLPEHQDINLGYMKIYEHIDPSVCAPFNFEGLHLQWEASEFEDFISSFESFMEQFYIPVYSMSNHDQPRITNRIGAAAARTMAMMQLTLPGMPILYYGDELGMSGHEIPTNKVQDPVEKRIPGKHMGRDPSRTPMQWSVKPNAGFSVAEPWLPVNPDFKMVNALKEYKDPTSMLNLYKKLIELRNSTNALKHGSFKAHSLRKNVFCYEREINKDHVLVVLNFLDGPLSIQDELLNGKLLISTDPTKQETELKGSVELAANEGIVFRRAFVET